ncbi:MAG: sialidase family protein [Nitrososphaerota archaeon]|nr:exo-alpha-sialidase [Candidatus Bathyarchaeota archaeon]MDW8048575.1 sialidase family protein [Nitrososphaerota archaeon]
MAQIFGSELIFEEGRFPDCHAPTIAQLPGGDLLAAWFAGSREGASDVAIYCSRFSGDSWSDPEVLADVPGKSDQNPVLFVDPNGVVWLWYVSHDQGGPSSIIMYKKSFDGGNTWSEDKIFRPRRGLWVRNNPIVLDNGDIVLPIYDSKAKPNCCYVMISEDMGEVWDTYGPVTSVTGCVQGNIVQLSDGSLLMYMRTRSHPLHGFLKATVRRTVQDSTGKIAEKKELLNIGGFIWKSISNDRGRTWSEAVETQFPNPNSGISLIRLKNGHFVLAFNDTHIGRTPLNVAFSIDEGQTWPYERVLEDAFGQFSYPQLLQTDDGIIHIVYTYLRRSIKHCWFNEEWLMEVQATEREPDVGD